MESVLDSWSTRFEVSWVDRRLEHVRICLEIGIKRIDTNPTKRPFTWRIIEMLDEMEHTYGSVETDNNCTSSASHANNGFIELRQRAPQMQRPELAGDEGDPVPAQLLEVQQPGLPRQVEGGEAVSDLPDHVQGHAQRREAAQHKLGWLWHGVAAAAKWRRRRGIIRARIWWHVRHYRRHARELILGIGWVG